MPFLSHHSLIWLSLQELISASERDWVAAWAEDEAEDLNAANWFEETRELRRTEAMSLSRDDVCGTGIPRSSHHAFRSDSLQDE